MLLLVALYVVTAGASNTEHPMACCLFIPSNRPHTGLHVPNVIILPSACTPQCAQPERTQTVHAFHVHNMPCMHQMCYVISTCARLRARQTAAPKPCRVKHHRRTCC